MEKLYRKNRKQLYKKNLASLKRKFGVLIKNQTSLNIAWSK